MPLSPRDIPASASRVESTVAHAASGGDTHTYDQILKSSALIGGSSALNFALGIIRTKAIALLLGPAGFGLMGLYTSIVNLAQSIAGMGINGSGVRQIAVAVASGDTQRIVRTASVLRRASVVFGLLGATLLILLSRAVAKLTFNDYEQAFPVAMLSLAVLCLVVSGGQSALIQGVRRIPDLARIAVLGALIGTVLGVALVYAFRERGVVPSLIVSTGASLLLSWRYSRGLMLETPVLSAAEIVQEAGALLKLGFAFMMSGMLIMGGAYAVRIMIVRQISFEAAGLYQSAWTIGGLYVGFILQAMGTDFYPRLTAVVRDHDACNRLVNEQAQVSLLLAGPGVIATLTFAPLVIALFYSPDFGEAAGILRWICLGATFQVISFPIGYIIVAQGRQAIFIWEEVAYTVVYLGLASFLVGRLGVNGAGAAFFASYVFHSVMVYFIVRWLTGFRWSTTTGRIGILYLAVIALVFCSSYAIPGRPSTIVGTLALLFSAVYSLRVLAGLVSAHRVPRSIVRLLAWARLAHPGNP